MSVTSLNGLVYVAAGSLNQVRTNAFWSYDPSTARWTSLAPYPGTPVDHAGLIAVGSYLYLIGGVSAWPQPSVASVSRYDPASNTWTAMASLPIARGAMGVAAVNGKIYVAGGLENGASVADFTAYDPSTNTWQVLPSMPTARDHLTGAAINGQFYALGGRINGQTCSPMAVVEIYDPTANAWATGPPMLTGHAGHAVGTVNGHIQIFGGEGGAGTCGTIAQSEDFDPVAKSWSTLPNMPTPRHGTGGATIGSSVFIPGGGVWSGDAATEVHERFDASGTAVSGPPPSPWSNGDIGTVGLAGSAAVSNGVYTVQAEGSDIWGAADAFQYVSRPLTGDGQIVVRADALGYTNTYAKAGVMIRETLTAGSRHVLLDVRPEGSLEFMTRTSTGGSTTFVAGGTASYPAWLRLSRSGSTFSAAASADGVTWTPVGSTTVSMASNVFVGMAVASHQASTLTSATFTNVSVVTSASDAPPIVTLTSPATNSTYTAPATVNLAASASDSDGTVTRVDFYANTTLVGSATAAPYTATWSNAPAGSYSMTAVATDNAGLQTTSAAASITIAAPPPTPLPTPWTDQDVGSVGLAGSASYSNGAFTVSGAGADIWGSADAFNYLSQPISGDGRLVARVSSLQNTNAYAKAGVMLRESLTAGAAHVILDVTPGGSIEFMTRPNAGASTTFLAGASASFPVWLRITLSSTTVIGESSADGTNWTEVGRTTISFSPAYAGLPVTSHTTSALTTAAFDSVVYTAGTPNLPPSVTLDSPSSGAVYDAPGPIALSATAIDSDGTVSKVDFYAGTTLLGTSTSSPFAFNWTNAAAGSYTVKAVATDNSGNTATSALASVTVNSAPTSTLPAPWVNRDVGSVGKTGSAAYSNGTFTVKGGGADIWGTTDAFQFVYQSLTGDGVVVARVASLQSTNSGAKAGVMFRQSLAPSDVHALLDMQPSSGGEFIDRSDPGAGTNVDGAFTLSIPGWVRLSRVANALTASVSSDGSTWTDVNTLTLALPGTVYVGLVVCNHDATALATATFTNVSVTATAPPPPPSVSFARKTIVVGSGGTPPVTAVSAPNLYGPSSVALAPDGRLYVSGVNGRLFAFTLDQTKMGADNQAPVTHVQEFDDIYLKPSVVCDSNGNNCTLQSGSGSGRQVTGIAIDPTSTAGNVILYVSNSDLSHSTTDLTIYPYSGKITRLVLQPNQASPGDMLVVSNQDLVTGLPRSREAHSPNGMSIGPDNWLYLGIGGNTNAGQPSTFFGNLAEFYLSAAVVRLNLGALAGRTLPIDVTNVTKASDMTPLQGTFELFATGYRNPYDLTWHSNGRLYLNGNAANLDQGNTPGSSDGCSTPSVSPGNQLDTLNIVTAGAYGGHPAPIRGQCVWGDGTIYSPPLAPDPKYVTPIALYDNGSSTNGIAEYTSSALNGIMKGNLISATWAGDQNVRRVVLTSDGSGVQSITNLGQFSEPLDVATDQSGVIYVAEYGNNQITLMIPSQLASCPIPGSDPKVTDSDGDGYTDYDEQANGTDPCSAASVPPDFNQNHVSDLLDPDDDSDGINDPVDQLYFDAQNGGATTVPLAFEWNPGDPAYGKVANSGFTGIQISSNASKDAASGHALIAAGIHAGDAGGHLTMFTYPGTAEGSANSQVNALQVGFDSSIDFRIWSRITQPFTGTTPAAGHVGGIFFGPNEDNYARLALIGTATGGTVLQFGVETGGVFVEQARVDLTGIALSNLDLFIVGTPGHQGLTAYYDVNTSGTMTALGSPVVVPASWFSSNLGAAAANTSLTGLMTSNGAAPQMAFVYDFFRVDRNVPPAPTFPPASPSTPSPSNGATGVAATTALSWAAATNAATYDVALGTSNPPSIVATGLTTTSYQPPSALTAGATFYWQVIARNSAGSAASPVWSFTTYVNVPPPSAPSNPVPTNGATGVSTSASLSWTASSNATAYDVAFGAANPPPIVSTGQSGTTYQPSSLAASTTYYWQVTAKGGGGSTASPVWSFTTGAAPQPTDVVIHAASVPAPGVHGAWALVSDATAADGQKLSTPDQGFSATKAPLASPTHYVDVTFNAMAGVPYHVWLRLEALNNSKYNDSVWVQFSDALANGAPVYQINTTSALLVNLATSANATSLNGWGWMDGAYWLTQANPVTFATSGTHTIRVQVREDGVSFDQIVISPTTYLNAAPGPPTADTTIVPQSP